VVEPCFFAMPQSEPRRLKVRPRLASWMATAHPDQIRLRAYLRYVADLISAPAGESAVRLDVGLPLDLDPLDQRDLDNYLLPVATRIGPAVTSFWATKSHQLPSLLRVEPARPADSPEVHARTTTTAAGDSKKYKEQVRNAVADLDVLADGPVGLEIAFVVGPKRNWLNLWKPTIDALGPILGSTHPSNPWHPCDGRIVRLGLHNRVDPQLGNHVRIALHANRLESATVERNDRFAHRAGGPIDEVFDRVLAHRDITIERLEVDHPADDDNLWYFVDPITGHRPVQIGCGRTGQPPFHVEGDNRCLGTTDPVEAAETILKWL
jgi:hypothetical protein